jgi:tetratricopeptide (TPR) repeat protein
MWRSRVMATIILLFAACIYALFYRAERDFQKGLELLAAGKHDEATHVFAAVAKHDGVAADAVRFNYGLALYHAGQFDSARRMFESLSGADNWVIRAQAAYNAGNCAWRLGDKAFASRSYSVAIKLAEQAEKHARKEDKNAVAEVRRRAAFNLQLANREIEHPVTVETSQSSAMMPEKNIATIEETSESNLPGPAAAGNPSTMTPVAASRLRQGSDVLHGILLKDTGPSLSRPVGARDDGRPDW